MHIKATNISKQFKNNVLFTNINLDLYSGNIYGLIGHNGSGKTVLMKILTGVMKPTTGTVEIDDKTLHQDIHILPEVGVIFEKPEFFNDLTGKENLELLAKINKRIDDKKIIETMKQVNLDPNNQNKVKDYSLGMVQRLGIAQAIMEDQKILILDEPTNALDQDGVISILRLLKHKKEEGCLILISSHQLDEIFAICDEVYQINHQNLIKVDKQEERKFNL